MTFRRQRITALIFTLIFGVLCGHAGSVRTINLDQMTRRAAVIFSGRCVETRTERDPASERDTTLVTFEVDRVVKGELDSTHTIRVLGGNGSNGRWEIPGLPRFRPGEEVVVYLYGESGSGLTSPVGFGQGKFDVHRDKEGRALVRNERANGNLFRDLSDESGARLDAVGSRDPRTLTVDALLDMSAALRQARP